MSGEVNDSTFISKSKFFEKFPTIQEKVKTSEIGYLDDKFKDYFKGGAEKRLHQMNVVISGKPLVTQARERYINGQVVYEPTDKPLSEKELKKMLDKKDLNSNTRAIYELELKRQQQGGFLTPEQAEQWITLQEQAGEEHMEKMQNILENGF